MLIYDERLNEDCKRLWLGGLEYGITPDDLLTVMCIHSADGPSGRHTLVVDKLGDILWVTRSGVKITREVCKSLWLDWKAHQANYFAVN